MTDVRALTLWQPWASLVALGLKRIETRSWSTPYRGRLLIHAAAKVPTIAPCGDWRIGRSTLRYADRTERSYAYTLPGDGGVVPLPLGAVVASCMLDDVVPMVRRDSTAGATVRGPRLIIVDGAGPVNLWHSRDNGELPRSVDGELPFGDYSPGRFAWLLSDVQATTDRCPCCWGSGAGAVCERCGGCGGRFDATFVEGGCGGCGGVGVHACPACAGDGRCEPVPMRGRQRLWVPPGWPT